MLIRHRRPTEYNVVGVVIVVGRVRVCLLYVVLFWRWDFLCVCFGVFLCVFCVFGVFFKILKLLC